MTREIPVFKKVHVKIILVSCLYALCTVPSVIYKYKTEEGIDIYKQYKNQSIIRR